MLGARQRGKTTWLVQQWLSLPVGDGFVVVLNEHHRRNVVDMVIQIARDELAVQTWPARQDHRGLRGWVRGLLASGAARAEIVEKVEKWAMSRTFTIESIRAGRHVGVRGPSFWDDVDAILAALSSSKPVAMTATGRVGMMMTDAP